MDNLHAEIMKGFIESLREDDGELCGYKITTFADDGTEIDVLDPSLSAEEVVRAMEGDDA